MILCCHCRPGTGRSSISHIDLFASPKTPALRTVASLEEEYYHNKIYAAFVVSRCSSLCLSNVERVERGFRPSWLRRNGQQFRRREGRRDYGALRPELSDVSMSGLPVCV